VKRLKEQARFENLTEEATKQKPLKRGFLFALVFIFRLFISVLRAMLAVLAPIWLTK
jgi:hypothetical protein